MNALIDVHSHILPKMDDGSGSVEETLSMLRMSAEQGVKVMVATPHFYAEENSPSEFVRRRSHSWERLRPYLTEEHPRILLGAEVQYFEGITRVPDLDRLKISGTDVLLIEMPFMVWTNRVISDIITLSKSSDTIILLAHIERFFRWQKPNSPVWEEFRENGVRMQVNASYFLEWNGRRRGLRMLENGEIDLIGSDCHNTRKRAPNMGDAAEVIEQALGRRVLWQMTSRGEELLRLGESRKR